MRMGAEGSRGVHQVSRQPPTHGRRSRGSDNGGGLSEPGQPIAGGQAAEAIGYGGVYSGGENTAPPAAAPAGTRPRAGPGAYTEADLKREGLGNNFVRILRAIPVSCSPRSL